MYQSRDEVRQVYLAVWKKLQQDQLLEPMEALIADVIEIHPEYHALLDDSETATQGDFSPEQGQTNPFLHMSMHLAAGDDMDFLSTSSIYSLFESPMDGRPGLVLYAVHTF